MRFPHKSYAYATRRLLRYLITQKHKVDSIDHIDHMDHIDHIDHNRVDHTRMKVILRLC